jgi:hypothetical protein
MLGESFGAIATLKQKAPAFGDVGQRRLQPPGLTGKNERRKFREPRLGGRERLCIRNPEPLRFSASP